MAVNDDRLVLLDNIRHHFGHFNDWSGAGNRAERKKEDNQADGAEARKTPPARPHGKHLEDNEETARIGGNLGPQGRNPNFQQPINGPFGCQAPEDGPLIAGGTRGAAGTLLPTTSLDRLSLERLAPIHRSDDKVV